VKYSTPLPPLYGPYDPHGPRARRSDAGVPRKPRVGPLSVILTPHFLMLVMMASEGMSNKAIAEEMMLSVGTVKQYFERIYRLLGVNNRAQLVARYVRETMGK
jgi:DNA-binding NarL/FixJ family response regulator